MSESDEMKIEKDYHGDMVEKEHEMLILSLATWIKTF